MKNLVLKFVLNNIYLCVKTTNQIIFIRANKTKYGGAENYLSRLCNELDKQNITYKVLYSKLPKFLPSWLRAILFNIQICLQKKEGLYFSLERITCADVYRAGDGVHKVFLQVVQKSKFNLLHPLYLFLEKYCFNHSQHIIANSQMIKEQIISTYGITRDKISVIYNGINFKAINYQHSFAKLSAEFALMPQQKILLYVGSGFKRKGVQEFLEVLSQLSHKNFKAFIIGKEKNMGFYKRLAKLLGVDNCVIFTGTRIDVDDFYTIADIFLLPTHYEPFSNVVLEAMSFEAAVFTTEQNGASEILDKWYVMQNPRDMSVVKKIDDLLSNKTKLQHLKHQNKLKSAQFSIEKNVANTLKVLAKINSQDFKK